MNEAPKMQHVCDGCGETVDAAHVRDRIARLEMATRFRPLHMTTLLLAASPPAPVEEFFYFAARDLRSSGGGSDIFHQVMRGAGVDATGKTAEACLAEFQRHGIYLAYVNECPAVREVSLARLAETLARRIRFSYKPKNVVALDSAASAVMQNLSAGKLPGIRVLEAAADARFP